MIIYIVDEQIVSYTNTNLFHMENIVINFAGDIFLAQAVKSYLSSQKLVSGIYMISDSDEISVWFEKNNKRIGKRVILDILRKYLTRYQIMELENILTVGIPKRIDEISTLLMCEICGWRVNTEEELLIHRRTHWI